MVSSGSSKSSFPNSSWADSGIEWKGTTQTVGFFGPSAPPLLTPVAFEVPSVAAKGVGNGTSRFGSFDVPGVSAFTGLAVELSINPITGDSGADRVAVSEPLSIQLRKS